MMMNTSSLEVKTELNAAVRSYLASRHDGPHASGQLIIEDMPIGLLADR